MSEDLMVQILAMACVVATLALGVFAVVKIIKAAAVEHDARLDQQQRGQDRLQADAHALGLAVRTERSEHALAPTPKRIAQGSVDGVPLRLEQGWRVVAGEHAHVYARARVAAELRPGSADVLQISLETTLTQARTELFGASDLQCGAADLDSQYRFHSDQPERATKILQSSSFQDALRTLTRLAGDWELRLEATTVTAESVSERVPDFRVVAEAVVRLVQALKGTAQGGI